MARTLCKYHIHFNFISFISHSVHKGGARLNRVSQYKKPLKIAPTLPWVHSIALSSNKKGKNCIKKSFKCYNTKRYHWPKKAHSEWVFLKKIHLFLFNKAHVGSQYNEKHKIVCPIKHCQCVYKYLTANFLLLCLLFRVSDEFALYSVADCRLLRLTLVTQIHCVEIATTKSQVNDLTLNFFLSPFAYKSLIKYILVQHKMCKASVRSRSRSFVRSLVRQLVC